MVFGHKMYVFSGKNWSFNGHIDGFRSENESYQWEKIVLMIKLSGFSGKVYVLLGKVGKYRL